MASEAPASSYAKRKNPDSDADMDVDGGDTLEQRKPQFTETDVIPCTGEEPGEPRKERHSGAVLIGGPPSTRITPEFSKWASDERPSPSDGRSKQEAMQKPCKDSDIEKITEDSAVTTPEARVRELEQQLSREFGAGGGGEQMPHLHGFVLYAPTSIQCWHVHCEECWLWTLGAKKLCPQCNTITVPGDLRRIYLKASHPCRPYLEQFHLPQPL
ncbi:hypothetical protein ACRRTK_012600 [Alexandromys fortis]